MKNKYLHKVYSDSEIKEYLSGKLDEQEMQSFEKDIVNDPFLAEAMEGFITNNKTNIASTLNETKESIHKKHKSKIILSFLNNWRTAAAVFILVVAGISLLLIIKKQPDTLVIKPIIKDSVKNNNIVEKNRNPENKLLNDKKKEIKPDEHIDKIDPKAHLNEFAGNNIGNHSNVSFLKGNEFKGFVQDINGHPLANVLVFTKNKLITTKTDYLGHFSFHSMDSLLEIELLRKGYQSVNRQIKTNAGDTIQLSPKK